MKFMVSDWKLLVSINDPFPLWNCTCLVTVVRKCSKSGRLRSTLVQSLQKRIQISDFCWHMSKFPCLRGCFFRDTPVVPSGKRLHNYGKSPFFMGKSTINGPCSTANCLFTGGYHISDLSIRHVHLGIAVPSKPSRRERRKQRGSCRIQNRVEKSTMLWYGCSYM